MAKNNQPIYWYPELTPEAEEMDVAFLASLFAPVIRRLLAEGKV